MARHHEAGYVLTAQDGSISSGLNAGGNMTTMSDDEVASDVDEPPDEGICFARYSPQGAHTPRIQNHSITKSPNQQLRNPSLLTQALLKSPDPTPLENEPPLLTSDGGMTSPTRTNTPSPPLPDSNDTGIMLNPVKDLPGVALASDLRLTQLPEQIEVERSKESTVEAGLGRPRRITFACGGKNPPNLNDHISSAINPDISQPPADPPTRLCRLRFTCPTRPSLATSRNHQAARKPSSNLVESVRPSTSSSALPPVPLENRRRHLDSEPTVTNALEINGSRGSENGPSSNPSAYTRKKLKRSEATRFHEFAASFNVEDDWILEQPAQQEKITVQDTLRKENLIRRLTEEADEEALEDEVEQETEAYENTNKLRLDDEELETEYGSSDGGNETDDEEGFADSDDDSDHGSQYRFWTSGRTTAATSTEHIEHIRPMTHRVASESSIESMINTLDQSTGQGQSKKRNRKNRHQPKPPKMRPGTPDLPDSTDFVCGTLDEDRPIEAAYMSCLEERRRSRHKIIPQDIDPSFPTSDLDEDDDDEDDDAAAQASDDHLWVMGRPDNSDLDYSVSPRQVISRVRGKSPMPSPKRPRSPAPPRRNILLRSPPPRCLFGRSPVHNRPRFMHQKLKSPPSSRRASITLSPQGGDRGIIMSHLAQRPYLTHTTSLPRTPNPFWRQHRDSHFDGSDEAHSMTASPKTAHVEGYKTFGRGPINIVRGLENKRRWRKERLYRQQIRHTGKDKERRCLPGKGAERMKEVGLEMAGKGKGHCQRAELILSV